MRKKLTLEELALLDTASAYNGTQHKEICGKATLELIEYKQIEQELGIDLTILFQALKNGIYDKQGKFYYPSLACLDDEYQTEWILIEEQGDHKPDLWFRFKDYGKTWALTKEELMSKDLNEKEVPAKTFEELVGEPREVLYKKLKAFEIIKEKEVNVYILIRFLNAYCVDSARMEYNRYVYTKHLTHEECVLLKEVLL